MAVSGHLELSEVKVTGPLSVDTTFNFDTPSELEAAVTPIIQVIARSQGDGKTTSKVVELPENSHIVVISLVDLTPNTEYTVTGRILFQTFDDVEGSVEENGEDFNAEDRAADTSGSFVLRRHGGDCALSVWEAGSNEMNVQTPDLEFSEEVLAVPLLELGGPENTETWCNLVKGGDHIELFSMTNLCHCASFAVHHLQVLQKRRPLQLAHRLKGFNLTPKMLHFELHLGQLNDRLKKVVDRCEVMNSVQEQIAEHVGGITRLEHSITEVRSAPFDEYDVAAEKQLTDELVERLTSFFEFLLSVVQERYLDPIEELVFQSSSVFEEMEKETVNEMQRSIIAEVATTLTALEEELRGLRSKVQDSFHSSLHAEEVLTKKIEKGTPIQAHVAEALGMQTELEEMVVDEAMTPDFASMFSVVQSWLKSCEGVLVQVQELRPAIVAEGEKYDQQIACVVELQRAVAPLHLDIQEYFCSPEGNNIFMEASEARNRFWDFAVNSLQEELELCNTKSATMWQEVQELLRKNADSLNDLLRQREASLQRVVNSRDKQVSKYEGKMKEALDGQLPEDFASAKKKRDKAQNQKDVAEKELVLMMSRLSNIKTQLASCQASM